ncbi:MAG TPA: chromosome segregation protein SMC [Chloroflexota bacterium]|nr:chromosome segregation protein SMC [Chloroflexota bacterium]
MKSTSTRIAARITTTIPDRNKPRRRFGCGLLGNVRPPHLESWTRQFTKWLFGRKPGGDLYNRPLPLPEPSLLFLRNIDIAGFKSFARPVSLELSPGITALVGANGSGKSNVVEAIRWCLGEQNVRDLRGSRAEDVIYAGQRRALGAAEVRLTFASDAVDAVVWSEKSLARRVHRSGDSDYLLNGERVRLKDLTAAVRQIGIDGARHIVVTQGMADGLLAATPQERRALLEHAAGLSIYRAQRDEARAKLETTDGNLQTIEVVLAEMEPRLRLLKRQARAVQERAELAEHLQQALATWYASRWHAATGHLAELGRTVVDAGSARYRAEEELRAFERRAEAFMEEERAAARRRDLARAALHGTQREHDAARFSLAHLEERLAESRRRVADVESRVRRLAAASREAQEHSAALDGLLRQRLADEESVRAEMHDVEQRLDRHRQALATIERTETARADLREKRVRRQAELIARLESIEERRQQCADGALKHRDAAGALLSEVRAIEKRVGERRHECMVRQAVVDEACQDARQADQRGEELRRLLERIGRAQSRLGKQQAACARQLERARLARNDLDGANELLSRLRVPPELERSLASALAPTLAGSAPEPEDLQAAEEASLRGWRETVAGHIDDAVIWADQVVETSSWRLRRALLTTVFVDGRETAVRLWRTLAPLPAHLVGSPPLQIVTRRGEVWSAAGMESERDTGQTEQYLRLGRDVRRIELRVVALDMRLARLATMLSAIRQAEAAARQEACRAASVLEEGRENLAAAQRALEQDERRHWQLSLALEREQESAASAASQADGLAVDADRLQSELQDLNVAATEHDADKVAPDRLREARAAVEAAVSDRLAISDRLAALEAARSAIATEIERERSALRRLEQDEALLAKEQRALDVEIARQEVAAAADRERLVDLDALLAEQQRRLTQVEAENTADPIDLAVMQTLRSRVAALMGDHERALASHRHAELQAAELRSEIAGQLGVPVSGLPEAAPDAPSDDDIRRLRARVAQYASVDDTVVAEYRELDERYTRLHTHLEDLRAAAEDLREIMQSADREMQKRFATSLLDVSREFARVFQVMLRGGEADLDETDDGGIVIRARLPGRRARPSAAFSGGERTLVASCLLFGVLKIRPTPFCVLDEVDAALDESNVDRFLAALRDIGERTQILIVTHNRATMAAADALYGVTMDPDGVSSLLSLSLEAFEAAG